MYLIYNTLYDTDKLSWIGFDTGLRNSITVRFD